VLTELLLQAMQPSDVAVMVREDAKIGMPRFAKLIKGMDFGRMFATQFASPLTGEGSGGSPGAASIMAAQDQGTESLGEGTGGGGRGKGAGGLHAHRHFKQKHCRSAAANCQLAILPYSGWLQGSG